MKHSLLFASFAIAAAVVSSTFAQNAAQGGPRGRMGRPDRGARPFMQGQMGGGMMQMQQPEMMFYRLLERPEFIKNLGLPEETVKVLQEGFDKIAAEERALLGERAELMRKNSEVLTAFMADRTQTTNALEQSFVDLESLQIKLAKLSVQRMVLIRDNLDADQIKNARESVKNQFEERRKARIEQFAQRGQRGGSNGGAERAKPGAKAEPAADVVPPAPPAAPAPVPDAPMAKPVE